MKIVKSIILLSLFSLAFSCSSKKNSTNSAQEIEATNTKMISDGFLSGKLISSEEGSACPVTIELDDKNYNYLLDPINLEDEFKKDGLAVWVKFNPLRMQNRCDNANPVNISEIRIKEN